AGVPLPGAAVAGFLNTYFCALQAHPKSCPQAIHRAASSMWITLGAQPRKLPESTRFCPHLSELTCVNGLSTGSGWSLWKTSGTSRFFGPLRARSRAYHTVPQVQLSFLSGTQSLSARVQVSPLLIGVSKSNTDWCPRR